MLVKASAVCAVGRVGGMCGRVCGRVGLGVGVLVCAVGRVGGMCIGLGVGVSISPCVRPCAVLVLWPVYVYRPRCWCGVVVC
jgi:hypothetical protein